MNVGELTVIETRHRRVNGGTRCAEDGQTYPCDAARLAVEIRRYRAVEYLPPSVPIGPEGPGRCCGPIG